MSDINSIVNGTLFDTSAATSSNSTGMNSLGKDAFLQLLVTQMQYQDPLNPQADTDFIAQLAQFSSLEQMQNLNQSFSNNEALNMVGKTVTITQTNANGNLTNYTGVVDFVTKSNGISYVSVDGTLYKAEFVTKVFDDNYLIQQKLPTVEASKEEFDHDDPKDIVVSINLGSDEYEASGVAVLVGDVNIDYKHLSYKDGKLTISKDAFKDFEAGTYAVAFVFANPVYTTVFDKVTLTVKGVGEKEEDLEGKPEDDKVPGESEGT